MPVSPPTEQFQYMLRIPRDRIAVLIGTGGTIKDQIESLTGVKLNVDSKEGSVTLAGSDALNLYTTREMVLAIGRGFNPDIAQLLMKPDYGIEIMSLQDYGDTDNDLQRLRGRVIGEEGKSRKTIESLTNTHISVYGKTIAIIGELELLPLARRAIMALLGGASHSGVYHMLERRRKELRMGGL